MIFSAMSKPLVSVALLLLSAPPHLVDGHVRMECPPPLSGETGEKVGPCDVRSDDGSLPAFPLRPNAFNMITWLESIGHPGAPARFALSRDGIALDDSDDTGFETCLLLDHVPHDAWSNPTFRDESTWHRSTITLWIPDVKCDRCYLQLVSVMSDGVHGVPNDTTCAYQASEAAEDYPACPVVYHSCAPVSIDGTIPRNDLAVCNTSEFEEKLGWPLTPDRNPDLYQYSTYFNRGDVGLYDPVGKRLLSIGSPLTDDICNNPLYCDPAVSFSELLAVPEGAAYASLEGSCASMAEAVVEPYQQSGILSSIEDTADPSPNATDIAPQDGSDTAADAVAEKTEEPLETAIDSGSLAIRVRSPIYATATMAVILMSLSL